jgi:hypothetical protein
VIFSLKYPELDLALSGKMSIRAIPLTLKKIGIIVFRG